MTTQRHLIVVGTRPEVIKMGCLIRELGEDCLWLHTGQHFDALLNSRVIEDLGIRTPDWLLDVGGRSRASQVSRGIDEVAKILSESHFSSVIVHGDTNSTLIGAVAGDLSDVPVVHVEAGLRSFDLAMPEERIRRAVDHVSSILFPPTISARENLNRENLGSRCAPVFGNTVVDAFFEFERSATRLLSPLNSPYILATFHRPENVDLDVRLRLLLEALGASPLPVIMPIHPRLSQALHREGIRLPNRLVPVDPLPPLEFHHFIKHAEVVITDSGGVIEEAATARVPLVSVRNSTERPEAMGTFAELVILEDLAQFIANMDQEFLVGWRSQLAELETPFGDGTTSEKIAKFLRSRFEDGE